jgi:predicted acetyltransferase
MNTNLKPEYLADINVTRAMDEELRALLTTCFTKPQDMIFRTQRYFRQPYKDRWIIKNEKGAMVAHIGVHDKKIMADGRTYRITGIAEVCVHPDFRGRGFVNMMLVDIHKWAKEQGFVFSMLFGDSKIYSSSGYLPRANVMHDADSPGGQTCKKQITPLVREISGTPWPATEVYLPGPTF